GRVAPRQLGSASEEERFEAPRREEPEARKAENAVHHLAQPLSKATVVPLSDRLLDLERRVALGLFADEQPSVRLHGLDERLYKSSSLRCVVRHAVAVDEVKRPARGRDPGVLSVERDSRNMVLASDAARGAKGSPLDFDRDHSVELCGKRERIEPSAAADVESRLMAHGEAMAENLRDTLITFILDPADRVWIGP